MDIRYITRRKPCIVDGNAGMTDSDRGQFVYRKAAIRCVEELEAQLEAVRDVVVILEESGEYCDCSCGTGHARLVKAAIGEDT